MKYRDKQTCFRCRALHISVAVAESLLANIKAQSRPGELVFFTSAAGAGCLLGWEIEVKDQPSGVSFYAPAAGVKCPKPLTHAELTDAVAAQARKKKNDNQIQLPLL